MGKKVETQNARSEDHIAGMKLELVELLYRRMGKKHVSQAELARKLGKTRAYIYQILTGTTNFTLETLVKISWCLNAEWRFKLVTRKKAKQNKKSEVV